MYVPLFRQEIYYNHRIVVYYDAGMFPHDQKQIVRKKPPKEKGQTPMTSVCPFQEKRIVNMAIVALPIQVMILVSLVRFLFYAVRKCCQH